MIQYQRPTPAAAAAPAGGGGGLGGISKLTGIGMVGGALGGVFGALGANKKAKIAAENQNKSSAWEHALNKANYGQTDLVRNSKRNRSAAIREALFKGITRAGSSGLSKILGGFGGTTGSRIGYNEAGVPQAVNVYDQAGAPPKLKAETGGWQSVVGGGLKGAFG
jgi:hypothetical protein